MQDRCLAASLQLLLMREQALQTACRLAAGPGSDTAPIARAFAALNEARVDVAEALVAALAEGEVLTLRITDGVVDVGDEHRATTPASPRTRAATPLAAVRLATPPPPARRVTTPSPPADRSALAGLQAAFAAGRDWHQAPQATSPLAWLERPQPIRNLSAVQRWGARFERAVDERLGWLTQPKGTQQALLTLVGALGRLLQEDGAAVPGSATLLERVAARFPELTTYASDHRPGHVWGLALSHAPRAGTWLADAQRSWDQLFRLDKPADGAARLQAVVDAVEGGVEDAALRNVTAAALGAGVSTSDRRLLDALSPRQLAFAGATEALFPTLRNHLREHVKALSAMAVAEDDAHPLPIGWAWLDKTAGRCVLTLGGDDRDQAVERWRAAFGFDEVVWESGWNVRRVQAAVERLRGGRFDLVILLRRFVSHTATNVVVPACKEAGVPFIPVDAGYGVTQIRLAIEQHLSLSSESDR